MTYEESAALMVNDPFRSRVKVACLKYAGFIMLEDATVPAHSTRIRWAQQTMLMPDGAAQTVTPPTVLDPAVQTAGAAIEDAALQSAVEGVVNKML